MYFVNSYSITTINEFYYWRAFALAVLLVVIAGETHELLYLGGDWWRLAGARLLTRRLDRTVSVGFCTQFTRLADGLENWRQTPTHATLLS
jgi:hypothetical protein